MNIMFKNIKAEKSDNKDNRNIKVTEFDQIFDRIKHYGQYQFFMLVVIQYIMLNSAGNYIFISFATLRPICQLKSFQVTFKNFKKNLLFR